MSGMQIVAAVLSIATGITGLITFFVSFWTARSDNQRRLRDRLRKQLESMEMLCHLHAQREGWEAIREPPQVSVQELDRIHRDGLISPSGSHIKRLHWIVRDIHGRSRLNLPQTALSREEFATLTAENERRLKIGFSTLDTEAQKYLKALGKMDNHGLGGYWTYLRYRFVRAREYVN
jgi:hypothetical protein